MLAMINPDMNKRDMNKRENRNREIELNENINAPESHHLNDDMIKFVNSVSMLKLIYP